MPHRHVKHFVRVWCGCVIARAAFLMREWSWRLWLFFHGHSCRAPLFSLLRSIVVARLPRQMSPVVRRTTQPFLRNRSEKLSRTFLLWSLKVSRSYAMAASSAVLKVSRVVKLLRWWQDREQLCRSNGGGT